jgi:GT2 family glycosyltransferase
MNRPGPSGLSIVTVNFRSWDKLARCLATLPPCEVIVVDNVSGDGLLPAFAAAHPRVRFLENDGNWGFADGCNRGAREASGEFLLFLNPDAEDPGGGIAQLLAVARAHTEAAIFTARQVDELGHAQKAFDVFPSLATLFGFARALLRRDPRRERAAYREVDWVSGSALLIRRSVFLSLGGFENGFWMYSEDVDLCRRARNAGHRVGFVGEATLVHAHGGATRRDSTTSSLTRSEVVISRHYYASRHFGAVHAALYHVALALTRFRPQVAHHLWRYYRTVRSQGWRSRRARPANL